MAQWQRRRHPEDVPTPIAVAVADFCRRAGGRSPAAVVREALAVLSDDDDFRVRAITDAEPAAQPLGPFALVDLVHGTDASLAAQRQQTGYYELVRTVAGKTAAPPRPPVAPPPARPPRASSVAARASRKQKKEHASLAEKIAPRRRPPVAARVEVPPPTPPPTRSWKRQLPAPRGRFTRIEPEATLLSDLNPPEAKAELQTLVAQAGNRVALRKHLERRFVTRRGVPPTEADVEALLDRHQLQKGLERREREAILGALTEHRGALAQVAWQLAISAPELGKLINRLGLDREVVEIRDRFVRESLSTRNLSLRLDLLGRGKYLADLKISRRFRETLDRDLLELLRDEPASGSVEQLATRAARRHGLRAPALQNAIEKLGLFARLNPSPA